MGVVATSFPHISARHLREAIDRLPELAGHQPALRADGTPVPGRRADRRGSRGTSRCTRAGSCSPRTISSSACPLERSANGHRMVQADKDDVELLGYLKLDILGVRMLSSMRHALDEIARTTGEKVDLDRIALDDERHVRDDPRLRHARVLPDRVARPARAAPEAAADALRRPDRRHLVVPARAGEVRHDPAVPASAVGVRAPGRTSIPASEPALQETYGVIVYHEQVMRTLAALAGYDLDLRRPHPAPPRSTSDLLPGFRSRLPRACGGPRCRSRCRRGAIWHAVTQFASFGFCKAHAAAFAVPTYRVVMAEDPLTRPTSYAGPADPRPGHVPQARDPRRRAASRASRSCPST